MPRNRTDQEITARIRELITRQEDLEDQLAGLTGHLRAEMESLAGRDMDEAGPRNVELDHVLDLLGRLAVAPTEADAVEVIVSAARELLPGTRGALCMTGSNGADMTVVGVWDAEEQWNRPYQHEPGDTPPQRLSNRVAPGPTGPPAMQFPVRGFGLRIGELRVWPEPDPQTIGGEDLEGRGELLARGAGLVLAGMELQQRLRHHTVRDPLTGLFNRRYLLDTLQRELHRSRRGRTPLGLVMLDIDRFGQFNDDQGHECGDRMLRQIAELLQGEFRESDVACRYSGERFALMLPQSDLAATRRRADTLCSRIAGLRAGTDAGITVSGGVSGYPAHGDAADAVIAAAETGITLARQAGGNCIGVVEPA